MKRCTDCGVVKPLGEFHRDRKARDGHTSLCRTCGTDRVKASQARRRLEIGEEAFRAEKRENQRRFRAKPDARNPGRLYARAQGSALRRLAEAYPDEYERLLTEERIAVGLPAVPYERMTDQTSCHLA